MNEPALGLDVGHAAPNDLVLTSYEEQHLVTYWPTGKGLLDRMASRRPCSPGSPSAAATAWRSWKAPARRSGDDPASTRAVRSCRAILSLAWASGAASRRLSCVVSALGLGAVGITHSLPSMEHVGTSWWQKRGELRHRGGQDRIEALKALRAPRVR